MVSERAAIGHLVEPFRGIDKLSDMNFSIVHFVRLPAWAWDLVLAVLISVRKGDMDCMGLEFVAVSIKVVPGLSISTKKATSVEALDYLRGGDARTWLWLTSVLDSRAGARHEMFCH